MYARANAAVLTSAEIEQCIKSTILGEVYTTPKPGLVDRHDNGAHHDMNVYTFERSADAITPYLAKMFFEGYFWKRNLQNLFPRIRWFDTAEILASASEMTEKALEADFFEMSQRTPVTHGEILFQKYKERGIRGEAQKGFPIIGETALPLMRQYRAIGLDENRSNINVLLRIMMELKDTNVWSRGSYADVIWIQEQAEKIWKPGGVFFETGMKKIEKLNQECIRRNLSPGGAADLLAATLFLYQLEKMI
ncbi:MAG TPA: hypothetical protein DCZ78_05045 [Blautia sp.]|uniref:triphosphoribosyl-dephospho-CoA synthase n=1 Tax=Blautia sp. TaxID=1955243 RepID=UPI000E8B2072|nr:triphosphoribosyl-dephospho-CoA synthase [Blautia sp.]HBB46199.1 hypothetical protein [Blautia sp.]